MQTHILQNANISYLEELLFDKDGRFQIVSYEQLKDVPQDHLVLFCVKHGMYSLPTQELIDFLENELEGKKEKSIEIGSGSGVICKALGIVGTDSLMQLRPEIKALYQGAQQPIVQYGQHVKNFDGKAAIRRYKPEIVVAAWVTHKYNPREHWREGNIYGVDEADLLQRVKKYVFIGNDSVHGDKPITELPHKVIREQWILSRSLSKEKNVIYIWEN